MARVLITGVSSGIGRASAELLTRAGHEVIATARRVETLDGLDVAARLPLDVGDPQQVTDALAAAGEIDVLVNNAGVSLWAPLEIASFEEFERVLATNLVGAARMTRAVIPQMRRRGRGRIIQVSSGAARRPNPFLTAYAASKAGLEALSWSLRVELRPFGVSVCVVTMGAIATSMDENRKVIDVADTPYGDLQRRTFARTAEIRRAPAPAGDVAAVIQRAIDDADPPFMNPVGAGLAAALASGASDAQIEAETLAGLGY